MLSQTYGPTLLLSLVGYLPVLISPDILLPYAWISRKSTVQRNAPSRRVNILGGKSVTWLIYGRGFARRTQLTHRPSVGGRIQ